MPAKRIPAISPAPVDEARATAAAEDAKGRGSFPGVAS
jgi:hypothetical protein